jgi:hypothetical protein
MTIILPPFVILNLFQDSKPWRVVLKQVQDDENDKMRG